MFQTAISCKNYCKDWFDKCMHEPDVNSRMIFIGTFAVTSLIMLAHTVVYLASHAKDPNYPTILTVLLGGHGVNALGRLMTKRGGGDDGNGNSDPHPAAAASPPVSAPPK